MSKSQSVRNQYKTVYELPTWGGMIMASIAVHEDDFNEDIWDRKIDDEAKWDKVRVEICVGGRCFSSTLVKLVDEQFGKIKPEKKEQ